MVLERMRQSEKSETELNILDALKQSPTKQTLHKLIGTYKNTIEFLTSRPHLFKIVIDSGLGRTVCHELVHLSIQTSFKAMVNQEMWKVVDKSGWSVGHEAAISHIEVAKKLIENTQNNQLLELKDNSGLSIGQVIYKRYKSTLTSTELDKLEKLLNASKVNKPESPIKEVIRVETSYSNTQIPVPVTVEKVEKLEPVVKTPKIETVSIKPIKIVDQKEQEKTEILKEINNLLKKHGMNAVRTTLSDDSVFASYLITNNVGLDILISPKGRTIAHYLASLNSDNAIKLMSNPDTANIVVKDTLWSVSHEAAFYHKEAARYAMDSHIDLWGISDINGKSVGHVAVKNYEDIAMSSLAHINSKKLLLVEDDHRRTVAHTGIYWSAFSLGVLEDPELYTLKDESNKPLILEAVRLHRSSAAKVQRSPSKYLSNLEQQHGKELLHILKAQLILHK